MNLTALPETGVVPDWLIPIGIRPLLWMGGQATSSARLAIVTDPLQNPPLPVATDAANRQHYEVLANFFGIVLGPKLKYSFCLFRTAGTTLAGAERELLRRTADRAGIREGIRLPELGCGWGSLTRWIGQRYPGESAVFRCQ